jgi:uncharacterized membrane protein YcaP (DUF421 family)
MEIVIRIVIIYVFIVFGLRVMGKREFSQLSPLELVTLLLVPEIVTQAIVGEDSSLTTALVGVATLFSLVYLSSLLQYHSKKAAVVIEGTPAVLVDRSQMVLRTMDQERISPDELFAEMHRAGLEDLSQVKWAILETDGRIAFIPYERSRSQSLMKDDEMMV